MSRYRLSRQAHADLDDIWSYIVIEKNRPAAAKRVIERLFETFERLAEQPELGTRRDDLRPNLRVFCPRKPAQNYLVFFYPLHEGIEVNTVLHAARDFPTLFGGGNE